MPLSRRTGQRFQASIWPGFVDAMTGLLLVLMFVLTIFTVVQFVLRETITGQENELNSLASEVLALGQALGLEQGRAIDLEVKLGDLSGQLESANAAATEQAALIASLRLASAVQEQALSEATAQIVSFEDQVAGLLAQRTVALSTIDNLQQQRTALEVERQDLLSREEALQVALTQSRSEVDLQTEQARLAATKREALEALIEDLHRDAADQQSVQAELTQRLSVSEEALSAGEAARLAEAAAAEALRDRLTNADAELTAMTMALEQQRKEAEDTLTLLAAADTVQDDLDMQLAAALLSKTDAETQSGLLQTELETTRDDLGAVTDKLALTAVQLEVTQDQLVMTQKQMQTVQQRLDTAQMALGEARGAADARAAQLSEIEQALAAALLDLENARIEAVVEQQAAERQVARLEAQNTALQSDLTIREDASVAQDDAMSKLQQQLALAAQDLQKNSEIAVSEQTEMSKKIRLLESELGALQAGALLKDQQFTALSLKSETERSTAADKYAALEQVLADLQIINDRQIAQFESLSSQVQEQRREAATTISDLQKALQLSQTEARDQDTRLTVLSERFAMERITASNAIERLKADLLALQALNAEQNDALSALSARNETERTVASGTIESLNADLRALQAENTGLKADLIALNEQYEVERLSAADTIGTLKADLLAVQSENASQEKDLVALTARYDSNSAASAGEISGLRADLLEVQIQNAGQQAALSELTARYDGLRATSTATIAELQDEARLLQAKINAQVTRLESLNAESSGYQNALLEATRAIAELRAELAKTREAAAQAKAALEQDADGLKKRLAAALTQKLADDAEQEDVRAKLAAALAAKLAAERTNADQMTEAEIRAALLSEAQKTLSKEKALSAKARREMALLNQQVAALRTQLQNLQGLLDDAMAKDIAEDVQLQNLGSQLNSALARVAAEERKRRRLEEAARKRLEREALELQGQANTLSSQAKDLEKYRSEFFGRLRDVLGQQDGVRIAGDRFVFSSEVLFPPGGADLSTEGQQEVAKVAEILKAVAGLIPEEINWVIRVDGHTDDTQVKPGSRFADNWHLSQARALSVVRYFANTLGIPPNRLAANGFGEHQPVNAENTPEARAQNRRIELKLTEK